MTNHEDPGWWPSLRGSWWYTIGVGFVMLARARPGETNGLIVLRSVFVGLIAAPLLFLFALSFIEPWDGGDERWVPWVMILIGIASLALISSIRRRPLLTTSLEALAHLYGGLFFIGVGVAEGAAMWGFVGVFLGGSLWISLIGLAFGLVGMWMIAPTRNDIERRQREITAAGSGLSLLCALTSVPLTGP